MINTKLRGSMRQILEVILAFQNENENAKMGAIKYVY